MAYGHLREDRRRMHLPLLEIFSGVLLLAAIVLAMIELARYSATKDTLQTDLTIAGLQVGGMDPNRARERWEEVYITQPVQLYFGDHLIMLNPADVGFRTNSDAMLAEARSRSTAATNFWLGFWNYLGRRPVAAVSVPLDEEGARKVFKLIDALEDLDDVQNVYANFDVPDDVMALIDA